MATKQSTIDYILDQLISEGAVSARKMFGEYALYCDDKVVGLVCDDTLYIKITEEGKQFVGRHYKEGHAYKGAKTSILVHDDQIEDREYISGLVRITAKNILPPKKKNRGKSL